MSPDESLQITTKQYCLIKNLSKMSKKLLTNDAELASKVENAMREQKIPCARIQLYKKEHGDAVPDKDKILLAVTNHNGPAMRNVIDSYEKKSDKFYYFGVLRNHPEYTIPRGIMKELAETKL